MSPKSVPEEQLSATLIGRWEQVGQKLTALAEAIPAEAYDSKPAEGTRTAAEVLRHVAFWNQYVAATARGEQADGSANELPAVEYATKAKIVSALRTSIADAAKALRKHPAFTAKETELVVPFLEHSSEHYGQLVVYARLKGVVPPAPQA